MSLVSNFIGIDIGAKGAISIINTKYLYTYHLDFDKASVKDIYAFLEGYKEKGSILAIEKIHAIPGAASRTTFALGTNNSKILTILELLDIPNVYYRPQYWQKALGVTVRDRKEKKKQIAELILKEYPDTELFGPRGGLKDGRSDALSIAHILHKEHSEGLIEDSFRF